MTSETTLQQLLNVDRRCSILLNLNVFWHRLCRKDLAFKAQAIFHHVLNQVRQVYTESHELFMTGEEYTE